MKRRAPIPAHMLTGSYFYAPVRAWIASGTFKHEPQPFGSNEVEASLRAAQARQTALANGIDGTITKGAHRSKEGLAKAVLISRGANPHGQSTFTCSLCGVVSFIAGSKMRNRARICSNCG